jgi:hypothetical protein
VDAVLVEDARRARGDPVPVGHLDTGVVECETLHGRVHAVHRNALVGRAQQGRYDEAAVTGDIPGGIQHRVERVRVAGIVVRPEIEHHHGVLGAYPRPKRHEPLVGSSALPVIEVH